MKFYSSNFTGGIPYWSGATAVADVDVYMDLHDNELEGLISSYFGDFDPTDLGSITVYDNKFTPKDILPHRDAIEAAADNYTYLPQKPFGRAQTVTGGTIIDRSFFDYTVNRYQWYKDGRALSGETSHSIDSGTYGTGTYKLEIAHPDINFTFESEPTEVATDGGGSAPGIPTLSSPQDGSTDHLTTLT